MTPEQKHFLRVGFRSAVNDDATTILVDEVARRMGDCETGDCLEAAIVSMTDDAQTSDFFLGMGVRSDVLLALSRGRRVRPS